MRGRAAGGRLKKGRTEGGFSKRAGGKAFSVGVARPSNESTESREWALGGTPANGTGKSHESRPEGLQVSETSFSSSSSSPPMVTGARTVLSRSPVRSGLGRAQRCSEKDPASQT